MSQKDEASEQVGRWTRSCSTGRPPRGPRYYTMGEEFVSGWDSGGPPALGARRPACGLGVLADSRGGLARHPDGQWAEGSRFRVRDLPASLGCCAGAWLF